MQYNVVENEKAVDYIFYYAAVGSTWLDGGVLRIDVVRPSVRLSICMSRSGP